MPDIGGREALMQLQGVWIVELAELTSLSRQEAHKIKQFMSSSSDRFREPYAKAVRDFPRQCAFAGTINPEGGYLKDPTGARRFWTVECGAGKPSDWQADVEALRQQRHQLWAEAVARYQAGESWWLPKEFKIQQTEVAADRYQVDAWDDLIRDHCEGKQSVSVGEILEHVLKLERGKWGKSEQTRVGMALTAIGWTRKNMTVVKLNSKKGREWRYVPPLEVEREVERAETIPTTSLVLPVPLNQTLSEYKQETNDTSSRNVVFPVSKKSYRPGGTRWNL